MTDAAVMGPSLEDLNRLFANAKPQNLRNGQVLFEVGDPADTLYLIDKGRLEISRIAVDGQKLTHNFMTGGLLGEIAALDGGMRTASARAITDCTLRSVKAAHVFALIRTDPDVAEALIRVLCARLRQIDRDVNAYATLTLRGRLAMRLLDLSAKTEDRTGWIRISQNDLAEYIGAARESVNKELADLKAENLVDQRRAAVKVVNAERLAEIASGID